MGCPVNGRACPVSGRASHWDNDYEAFVAEWADRVSGLPSVPVITATLNARGFAMQSDRKRRLSLYCVKHLLERMYHEGILRDRVCHAATIPPPSDTQYVLTTHKEITMSDWKRDSERAEYAAQFRKDAECKNKNGQTIISHVSMAEVQAPRNVRMSIEFREDNPLFMKEFDE